MTKVPDDDPTAALGSLADAFDANRRREDAQSRLAAAASEQDRARGAAEAVYAAAAKEAEAQRARETQQIASWRAGQVQQAEAGASEAQARIQGSGRPKSSTPDLAVALRSVQMHRLLAEEATAEVADTLEPVERVVFLRAEMRDAYTKARAAAIDLDHLRRGDGRPPLLSRSELMFALVAAGGVLVVLLGAALGAR